MFSYILNRGWIDKSSKRLPTYKEITSSRKGKEKVLEDDSEEETFDARSEQSEDEIDEDEFDEVAERFETSYNFRFEEPYVYVLLPEVPCMYSHTVMQRRSRNRAISSQSALTRSSTRYVAERGARETQGTEGGGAFEEEGRSEEGRKRT